ncbi:bifunctional phosphopantothenoylcysteine decarboxylase/phosphopantothenate--cysteine ligase CoaBC [Paenibacillus gallinarum]|uniref:Coenzyme A biosynthesis bifunctional protein CoaBC n=1 Tax=Paenibacillus gallinarum TaxID=2762232 RepID=A0ABR8SWX7_9BACL|nr:bifunctional phosphopantothenoylcysteine decarboxylase/phosphopantothenate--cysteine ligase CoaBC [Paenibacillus gallinarum]MBD7967849.1 bifunctional phosphopantothenoylcysteine decarboxylase/phosphopantothenate--cysteine ligase CoaBC [Paenibacillus gallinarum]
MLKGKKIVLGVTGGIAAYKAAALTSKLVQKGAEVHVIMTESAKKFITELTLQSLSRNPVYTDTFDERDASVVSHINLADTADLVLVAPATANTIAKMAHGLADDMLTTTLLATTAPVIIAPAMNVHMYEHPAVIANMNTLHSRGVHFIEPGVGQLACGYVGKGRLEEPETIVAALETFFEHRSQKGCLAGKKVVVTAGGTIERIDPVRYITNDSSGKMGVAFAAAAKDMGAEVTLVAANMQVPYPADVEVVKVQSAQEMYEAVHKLWPKTDIMVKAAAVADYRPAEAAKQKIKKKDDTFTLSLVKTIDILESLGKEKTHQYLIGFAAETNDVEFHAKGKLERKNADLIVANDVTKPGAGFGTDTNAVEIYDKHGLVKELAVISKDEVARQVFQIAISQMEGRE